MCGLAGLLQVSGTLDRQAIADAVHRMCDRMRARGPDALGYWSDSVAGLTLGHRRLAILDLVARANQPMVSDDGRHVIVFNGEIYNFREIRDSLERGGEVFHTQSDTEVLLKLCAREGEAALPRLRGMFAFAVWDRLTRNLFLARDPYGIKPLYLARTKAGWLFASQVKALQASGLVSREPDPVGQAGFWLLGSVPEPHTWFRDISALPAGAWCRITEDGEIVGPHKYWDIGECWREAPECHWTTREAQELVRDAVYKSTNHHLVADVPVGVYLSGGIDSGSLSGLMKDAGASNIQGVTIAFNDFQNTSDDEVPAASAIAQQYGIRHHLRTVSRREFEADLPRILSAMDQPSIDGVNTWYASKAVAEHGLKVAISGVGGDELLHGYSSFKQIPLLLSRWDQLSAIPGGKWMANASMALLARYTGNSRWRWLSREINSIYGAYWLRRGVFTPEELPVLMGEELAQEFLRNMDIQSFLKSMVGDLPSDCASAVGQLESMLYLRNQLLRDSDWASMDHSVELRTPLVDAWLLRALVPALRCFDKISGKELLAKAPSLPLPKAIIARRKTGFGIPLQKWFAKIKPGARIDRGSRFWARHLVSTYATERN